MRSFSQTDERTKGFIRYYPKSNKPPHPTLPQPPPQSCEDYYLRILKPVIRDFTEEGIK
jgi:hypothetical protein